MHRYVCTVLVYAIALPASALFWSLGDVSLVPLHSPARE